MRPKTKCLNSDDTIETLSVSEVDAGGEVFGDAAGTSKVEVTTWISAGANYQVWRPRPNPMEPRGVQLDLKNGCNILLLTYVCKRFFVKFDYVLQ